MVNAISLTVDGVAPGFSEETLIELGWVKEKTYYDGTCHYDWQGRSIAFVASGRIYSVGGQALQDRGQLLLSVGLQTDPSRSAVLERLGVRLTQGELKKIEKCTPDFLMISGPNLILTFDQETLLAVYLVDHDHFQRNLGRRAHPHALIDARSEMPKLVRLGP